MSHFQAISNTTHAGKRWKRYRNYNFAARDLVIPLVAQELPLALMHMPIGFIKQEEKFIPVAVLGLQSEQNLFVAADGRWIAGYTPAAYRVHPFQLAESTDGQRVLVIDEESGLIVDSEQNNETEGEAFFEEDGKPAKAVQDILDFLVQLHGHNELTQRICAVLASKQLIQPWPITIQSESGERKVEGLYRIDEAALTALPPDKFEALRQAGALPMAYCQLLSMQHLQTLGLLAAAHHNADQAEPGSPSGELNLDFLNDSGTLSFGPQ